MGTADRGYQTTKHTLCAIQILRSHENEYGGAESANFIQ